MCICMCVCVCVYIYIYHHHDGSVMIAELGSVPPLNNRTITVNKLGWIDELGWLAVLGRVWTENGNMRGRYGERKTNRR